MAMTSSSRTPTGVKRSQPLTKATWLSRLRTFGWVSFITVLVFVWADLEQTKSETITVTLRVTPPPNSDMRIAQPGPDGVKVRFSCRGGQGRIEEFLQELAADEIQGRDVSCVVQADPDWAPGEYLINVVAELNKWDRLRNAHLTAESPQESTITVVVDRWKTVAVTVSLKTSDDDALAGPPVIEPAKVRIRAPESRYAEIEDTLVIETQELSLSGQEPGKSITRPLSLKPGIKGVMVEFVDTSQVSVTFEIQERTHEGKIPVSVQLATTPELLERISSGGYVLSRKDRQEWRLDLTVSGPRKEVDRVSANPEGVRAFVRITESDLEHADTSPPRPVTVILPAGLKLREPTNPQVHFKFVQPDTAAP